MSDTDRLVEIERDHPSPANGDYIDIEQVSWLIDEVKRLRVIEMAARALVMSSTPFWSVLEMDLGVDGEAVHHALREALGITKDEWDNR